MGASRPCRSSVPNHFSFSNAYEVNLDTNSKTKSAVQLTRLKTHIHNDSNDGNDDDLSFMGSPPLLPLDDPNEYKKLREDVGKSAPADFFGQFFGRMFTDTAWEARRYQLVATNFLKAQLKQFLDLTVDHETKLALVVAETMADPERGFPCARVHAGTRKAKAVRGQSTHVIDQVLTFQIN
jgi:hypothetical protein